MRVGAYVISLSDVKPNDGSFRVGLYVWFLDPAGQFDIEHDLAVNARNVSIGSV